VGGLLKRDFHVIAKIVAPLRLAWVGAAATEEVFENPAAAEDFPEDFERIVERPAAKTPVRRSNAAWPCWS